MNPRTATVFHASSLSGVPDAVASLRWFAV
jgi:hypothetical protein